MCSSDLRHSDDEGYGSRTYRGDRLDRVSSADYNKNDRRFSQREYIDRRSGIGNESDSRDFERQTEFDERRDNNRNWDGRNGMRSSRDYDPNIQGAGGADRRRVSDHEPRSSMNQPSFYSDDRRSSALGNRFNGRSSRESIDREIGRAHV